MLVCRGAFTPPPHLQYNFVHELGIWEKQSSFLFQAKSCQTLIMGNVCVCCPLPMLF